jgi:hypothetical protein
MDVHEVKREVVVAEEGVARLLRVISLECHRFALDSDADRQLQLVARTRGDAEPGGHYYVNDAPVFEHVTTGWHYDDFIIDPHTDRLMEDALYAIWLYGKWRKLSSVTNGSSLLISSFPQHS